MHVALREMIVFFDTINYVLSVNNETINEIIICDAIFPGPNSPYVRVRSQATRDALLRVTTQLLQAHSGRVHEHAASAVTPPARLVNVTPRSRS